MTERERRARPIASVHVDIARLIFEVSKVSSLSEDSAESMERLGRWTKRLVECLAIRNCDLHEYGAHLLTEVDEYRNAEKERKRGNISKESADSKDSTESAERQPRTDRSDSTDHTEEKNIVRLQFEEARKAYPGTKRGLDPEWANFQRKHRDHLAEIAPLLLPAILAERKHKSNLKASQKFCPEWANFQTWINQARWTQEFTQPASEAAAPPTKWL